MPEELAISDAIDKYGVEAITGKRILRPGLLRRIRHVRTIINAFELRKKAESFSIFGRDNPELADILVEAERLAHGE